VSSRVKYCASVWNPYYQKDRELLEKIQRRFSI